MEAFGANSEDFPSGGETTMNFIVVGPDTDISFVVRSKALWKIHTVQTRLRGGAR